MANAKTENGVHGMPYLKPPEKTTWEYISTGLYNKTDNTILSRTPKGWAQLFFFYTMFYAVLGAMFAICMQGLFATLDDRTPAWILDRSLIGSNPGLGFRPISNNTDEGSLIWYDTKNATTSKKWIDLLDIFLKEYTITNKPNQVYCDFDKMPTEKEACEVNINNFGDCSPAQSYGFRSSSPCVFLKLNRIYGWVPHYYNNSKELPDEMPDDLKEEIASHANGSANQIWVSCSGENPVDVEHLNSSHFEYIPSRGFSGYYYPFTNVEGYQSPLIAVKVRNPAPNVMISIECRAWAKNIKYTGGYRDREGSVLFELMVDG